MEKFGAHAVAVDPPACDPPASGLKVANMRYMVVAFFVAFFLIWDTGFNRGRYTGAMSDTATRWVR